MMKRLSLLLSTVLLTHPAWAETGITQSPAYKECIALAAANPAQALAKADAWLATDTGIAAHHCRAMALYGLRRYVEAGDALNTLRGSITSENIELRNFVAKQASTAWMKAGRPDEAFTVLDNQLHDLDQSFGNNALAAKLTADMLLTRARLNMAYDKPKLAMQDLDRAVSLTPLNPALLVERAAAFERLNDDPLAKADVEAALTLKPDDAKARALLARLDSKKP